MAQITPFRLAAGTLGGAVLLKASAFAVAAAILALTSSAKVDNLHRVDTSGPDGARLTPAARYAKLEVLGTDPANGPAVGRF